MSYKDRIKDHIQRNKLAYGIGLGSAGTVTAMNLAGKGYFGSGPQLTVQDNLGRIARELNASAERELYKGHADAGIATYIRPDVLFTRSPESNLHLLTTERIFQKENIPYLAKKTGQTLAEKIGNVSSEEEKLNFALRQPLIAAQTTKDMHLNRFGGIKDSLEERLNQD